ncbi:hypothetical protein QR685DRAFT_431209 [Neurospora intermedia]|uniref:Uncharacterized protein n=1 Tax=Neurospora intermedia TaxID=5142 RepID=A0ABR3DT86_NEUIN
MSSASFSETRSQPPSPPSPASPPSPPSIPLSRSPYIPSTPSTGSPQDSTAPASSRASSQPTSAPSSHTSSTGSSIFDLSVFFSLNPQPVMTRDPSPGMTSPSLSSAEAGPQSIPQSMSSSQASENFTAPRGTWTISTEEYPRPTGNLQPHSQTSSEEGFIYFTGTIPLSPPIPLSRCRGGTPQINSQATSPDTSDPQPNINHHLTPILQVRMPGSWISSRSTSPIPSPSSSSQPNVQPYTETSSNPYPRPILHVTIMPGSWVSLPDSPISSLLSLPELDATSSDPVPPITCTSTTSTTLTNLRTPIAPAAPTTSTTPTRNDTDSTSDITIAIAGLNICDPTTSDTEPSIDTNINTNINTSTCTGPSDNTDENGPNAALTTLTTLRSSCEGGPPSPASSTGSFEPGCVQQ